MELFSILFLTFLVFAMLYVFGQLFYTVLVLKLFRVIVFWILGVSALYSLFVRPAEGFVLGAIVLPFALNLGFEHTARRIWNGFSVAVAWLMGVLMRLNHEHAGRHEYQREGASRSDETYNDRQSESYEKTPYYILEIPPSATREEVKKAYRAKMKHYHPDRYYGAPADVLLYVEAKTKEINGAYEALMAR